MQRETLKLIEAVAAGLFLWPMFWMGRTLLIRWDDPATGLGEDGVPGRWIGLIGASLLCLVISRLPRQHHWLAFSIGLTGAGLVWGLGINGPQGWTPPGQVWDIRVLWLYMSDNLTISQPRYDLWVSIAYISGVGLVMALAGVLMSVGFTESPLRELRRARQHKGTNRYRSRETVFGDAAWGDWRKIKETVGNPNGIVLGEDYDPRKNGTTFDLGKRATWGAGGKADLITLNTGFAGGHSLVFAGTGGGKTAGIVYPTALTYRHPIIVMDPQQEIYETVAKARKAMGFEARVIEVGSGLDLIALLKPWLAKSSIAYMHLADSLVAKEEALKSEYSQFFAAEGAGLISGLVQDLVTKNTKAVFKTLYTTVALPEATFKGYIQSITDDKTVDPAVRTRLASYAEMESKTFSNLQTSVKQALNWAAFPEMCDILDNEAAKAPPLLGAKTDVYIRLKISDLKSFPGMVRAILSAILYCVNETNDGIERLMIVDEAYQVGKLKGFELVRDTMRKRGLHLMLIFQSTGQIEEAYGKAGVRAWNNSVAARVYGTTEDPSDQAELSRMIGEYTVDIEGRSKSASVRGLGAGTPSSSSTKNTNLQRASLMRPEQLRTLPNDGLIVFFKGLNPIICGKAFSFRRAEWRHVTPFIPANPATTAASGGPAARLKRFVKFGQTPTPGP